MKDFDSRFKLRFVQNFELKRIIFASLFNGYFDREEVNDPARAKKNKNKGNIVGILVGILICIMIFAIPFYLILSYDYYIYKDTSSNDYPDLVKKKKKKEYSIFGITITKPDKFSMTSTEGNTITYLNNGNDNINQYFGVTRYDLDLNNSSIKLFRDNYIAYLEKTLNIKKNEEVNINDITEYKLKTTFK